MMMAEGFTHGLCSIGGRDGFKEGQFIVRVDDYQRGFSASQGLHIDELDVAVGADYI